MIGQLLHVMRLQAARNAADYQASAVGSIQNFDPNQWAVRVLLQPDGILTGYLPLSSPWVGNSWGLFAAPSIGDMVDVQFIDGDIEAGIATQRLFNAANRPLAVQSGEFWLVHKSGAFFKLLNTGAITFSDGQGASLTMDGAGNINSAANTWTHNGTINVTGNVAVTGGITATQDIVAGIISLMNHKHSAVQSGSQTSGPPVP